MKWTLLVYRIPSQPSKLRLQVWRRLQAMGALYLQDAVCVLPNEPELTENLGYVAASIQEVGGTSHLFFSESGLPMSDDLLVSEFRRLADARYGGIVERLQKLGEELEAALTIGHLEAAEESLKRERIAFLRARRIAYFGGEAEATVEGKLDEVRRMLDEALRGAK